MKRTFNKVLFLLFVFNFILSQSHNYLYKISSDKSEQIGSPTGYVNAKGDTVIPIGKYSYCYTDTLKNFAIVLNNKRCYAIDRNENELFEVKWIDNGPEYPNYMSEGLFRIIKNGKMGFANEEGRIIIKPIYSFVFPFQNGLAKATFNHRLKKDGEYKKTLSKSWFFINKKGEKVLQ